MKCRNRREWMRENGFYGERGSSFWKKITFRRRLKLQELPMEKQLAGDKETTEGEEEEEKN